MKKVSVVALVLVLALAFTGCTGAEQRLYKGFAKNQEITSLESDTNVTFKLEATDFPEEEQVMLQQAIGMLNNSKITMHQKAKTNEDKTVTKAYVDMDMTFGDMEMPMEAWVDMDMSKDKPEMLEIIKMPAMIMGMMENPNKEYLIYDFEEMMKELPEGQEEVNNSKLMEFSKDIQTKYVDFFNNYFKELDLGIKMATYKGTRSANGKSLYIYEVKLDDANFKKLIRNAVNNSLEKEETIKFVEEYMSDVVNIMEVPEGEQTSKEEMKKEVKDGLDKFKNDLPNIKKQFNEFMDKFEDVKILGDKGIVIEYGINSDGYIVNTKGNVDLAIDLEAIEKTFENATKTEETTEVETKVLSKGKLKLEIEFNTKLYNINKDVKIEMPKTTEENSLRMSDLMKQQMESIEEPEAAVIQ